MSAIREAGEVLERRELADMRGVAVALPGTRLVHLQFLRFAGCAICNIHLRPFIARQPELAAAGIDEVAVFHSSREDLLRHEAELPFAVIPDPEKALYREFGVEPSPRSLLDPRVWGRMLRGMFGSMWKAITRQAPAAPMRPPGGTLGLPADLLVAPDGRILAVKYGRHAADGWSVDEVLALAAEHGAADDGVRGAEEFAA